MKVISTLVTTAALLGSVGAAPHHHNDDSPEWRPQRPGPPSHHPERHLETDALARQGLKNLHRFVEEQLEEFIDIKHKKDDEKRKCTLKNAAVRREWSTLHPKEKKEYIAAVQCLSSKPAQTPSELAPGAKTRYDDFVATHINQTLSIHGTGNFLTWHRYFTWAYEQALRNECGYTGYQPYYSWPTWAADPASSPLFDGSETSISGDGAFIANRSDTCVPSPDACNIKIPPGNGGGCVTDGPFKNFTVNLGPVAPVLATTPNPLFTGLGHNPRCLRRDISRNASSTWTNDPSVVSLITNANSVLNFSTVLQGDFPAGFLGVHTAGHFTVGADPGGDLFASPGDPAFYFHHAMVDRAYWIWQNLGDGNDGLKARRLDVGGTDTVNNIPPGTPSTLEDVISLGYVGVPDVTIGEASDTLEGPFCYIYK